MVGGGGFAVRCRIRDVLVIPDCPVILKWQRTKLAKNILV